MNELSAKRAAKFEARCTKLCEMICMPRVPQIKQYRARNVEARNVQLCEI